MFRDDSFIRKFSIFAPCGSEVIVNEMLMMPVL